MRKSKVVVAFNKKRPNSPWLVRWREQGKARTKSFPTSADADEFAERKRKELGYGAGPITLDVYGEKWFEESKPAEGERNPKLRLSTWLHYRSGWTTYILEELGAFSLEGIDERMVAEFLRDLQDEHDLAASTIQSYYQPLKKILSKAYAERFIKANPAPGGLDLFNDVYKDRGRSNQARRRDAFPQELVKPFFDELRAGYPELEGLFIAMYLGGIRRGEALALKPESIRGNVMMISETLSAGKEKYSPKSGRRRSFTMPGPLADAMNRQLTLWRRRRLELGRPPSEWLFFLDDGDHVKPWDIRKAFHDTLGKVYDGDAWLTPHSLRHTITTELLESGANINHVADLLGHADISTTRKYDHVGTVDLPQQSEIAARFDAPVI